jgi:hypothetical protein
VLSPPPSRRPNPNGLPQPIRVRVRGGVAPSAAASPGRRPLAAGPRGVLSPLYIVPPVDQYNHLILLNSPLLSWYHEIELDLDSSRFRPAMQRLARRPLSSLPSSASRAGPSPPCRAAPRAPALPCRAVLLHVPLPCCTGHRPICRAATMLLPCCTGPSAVLLPCCTSPALRAVLLRPPTSGRLPYCTGHRPVYRAAHARRHRCAMTTGTADTEAAALEAAAATASPPSDIQP